MPPNPSGDAPTAPRANPSWLIVAGGFVVATSAGLLWALRVQALDREIASKRAALKKLHLSERIPPNREVIDYLTQRSEALEAQYRAAVALITIPSIVQGHEDPQLLFQQRIHEIGRTVERLAAARGMTPPEQLGFPKELPPADAVPRFLIQAGLIEEIAERIMVIQGLSRVESFKVEDPQSVAALERDQDTFLARLPVRVRLRCSLEVLPKMLGALIRARPVMDLQSLRVTPAPTAQDLEVELVLAGYLLSAPQVPQPEADPPPLPAGRGKTPRS